MASGPHTTTPQIVADPFTTCLYPRNPLPSQEPPYSDFIPDSFDTTWSVPDFLLGSNNSFQEGAQAAASLLSHSHNLQSYLPSPGQAHPSLPSSSHPVIHPGVDFFVTMSSPIPTDGNLVEHRRDTRIILEVEIRPRSMGAMGVNLPWDSIRIPQTKSVKRPVRGHKKALDFRLELQGATTRTLCNSLCRLCTEREPRNSLVPGTLVDFTSRTDVIDLKNGKAEVPFRFLCLSTHHGPADSEYRINAIISNGDEVLAQHALETCLRVTSRGARKKHSNINATRTNATLNSARSSEDQFQVSAEAALDSVASGSAPSTSTLEANMSANDFLLSSSRSLPSPPHATSPIVVQPAMQNLASNTATGDRGDGVISLLIPSRGTISGGEQIVLVVDNLPPSTTLFARFGDNIVTTFHHASGFLVCNLPSAAQPGTVKVTLSRTPSLGAPTYATSLAQFIYESDADRAVTHIRKIRDEALRSEAMPFIQRVFQSQGNRGPASSSHRGAE